MKSQAMLWDLRPQFKSCFYLFLALSLQRRSVTCGGLGECFTTPFTIIILLVFQPQVLIGPCSCSFGIGIISIPRPPRCVLLLFQFIGCSDKQECKGGAQEHLWNGIELTRRWRYRAIAVNTLSFPCLRHV